MLIDYHLFVSFASVVVGLLNSHVALSACDDEHFTLNITMQNYQSNTEDEIVFLQYKLPNEELIILGYTPLVSMTTVHHMNLVACERPASEELFWLSGTPCNIGVNMLLYGWDRDALPFRFPTDLGVIVGKNTPYKYLVVNIHYLPIVKNDYSGTQIIFGRKRPKHLVGVMSGGTSLIELPPRSYDIKAPFSCQYEGPNIFIFAVGVHAHQWAQVNSLYRVRGVNITTIVEVNAQQIHQSYLLPSPIDIVSGDYIIGQCVYDNTEDRVIKNGLTHNDEMCNVMAGYWYNPKKMDDKSAPVPFETCWGNEFPQLSMLVPTVSKILLHNITETERSNPMGGYYLSSMPLRKILIGTTLFATMLCIIASYLRYINHVWYRSGSWNNVFYRLKSYSDEENELE